jgi:MFS family permease
MVEPPYPSLPRGCVVVGILVLTAILAYTDRQVLSLLVDPIRKDLAISDTQVSLLIGTAFAVIYGIAGIPLGYLADRLSRRTLIFAGVLIWSAATLFCGLAQSYHQLFLGRILVGLGEAVLSPAAISLISDYFPPNRRGSAVGIYLGGIAVGIGSSLVIGGGVLHAVNQGLLAGTRLQTLAPWRLVLLCIGTPGLIWSLAILLIREPLRRGDHRGGVESSGNTAFLGAGWSRIITVYGVVAIASLVDNAVGAWTPSLLIRQFAGDPEQVGVQLGLLLVAGYFCGFVAGGFLADRAGTSGHGARKLRVCLIAVLLIVPVALALNSASLAVVMIAIPFYFAFSGVVTACGFSAILDMVPNRARGLAMAISFFLNVALGAGFGPAAVPLAGEHLFGSKAGLGPPLSFVMLASFVLAGAALLLTLRAQRSALTGKGNTLDAV